MEKGMTEIVCIIDKSGSMEAIKSDAIGGFNSFLETQKKEEGRARLTLTLFDTSYDVRLNNVDIEKVEPLNDKSYSPGGCTALLDAIGKTLDIVGERLSGASEESKPEKVLVAILTDGLENSSTDFTKTQINEKISHQREAYQWEFIFLAANQDAMAEAQGIGIPTAHAVSFAHTGEGARTAYAAMNNMTSAYRKTGKVKRNN